MSEKEILDEIIHQGVSFEPGEETDYSNSGYYLLTKIVEKEYKKPYVYIVEQQIARPLKLKNFSSVTPETKNVFKSYDYTDQWTEIEDFDFSNVIGVGDIVSTTKDLNTFITGLFRGKILKQESIEIMKPSDSKATFGRGLMIIPFYDIIYYGHGGDTRGTHSIAAYNENDKIAISFSINGERYPHNAFAIGLLSIIHEKEYDFQVFTEAIPLRPEDLVKYEGTYSSPDFPLKVTVFKKENVLYAQATGQPEFPLECYEKDKFKFDQARLKLEFTPGENKMVLNQNGMEIEMKKE